MYNNLKIRHYYEVDMDIRFLPYHFVLFYLVEIKFDDKLILL